MHEEQTVAVREKHRAAGRDVAGQYGDAVKEIHLRIKHRGTYTTWTARAAQRRHAA